MRIVPYHENIPHDGQGRHSGDVDPRDPEAGSITWSRLSAGDEGQPYELHPGVHAATVTIDGVLPSGFVGGWAGSTDGLNWAQIPNTADAMNGARHLPKPLWRFVKPGCDARSPAATLATFKMHIRFIQPVPPMPPAAGAGANVAHLV